MQIIISKPKQEVTVKSALNKNAFKVKLLTSLFKDGRFPAFIVWQVKFS